MDCPYCRIDLKKTRILKEGKYIRVIFSNPRMMPGHLLVIPKRHVERISELNKDEQKELFDAIIHFQDNILLKIASGCDIRQNYRAFQKQDGLKVNHLHFHLQPRELFDELYKKCQVFEKDVFKDSSKTELDKMEKMFSEG
jgi:histidine triad (HIT) family protein